MPLKPALRKLLFLSLLVVAASPAALAQGSSFTYQGRLADGGAPPTGTYELEFKLFDAAAGGTQQPQPSPVTVQFTGASAVAVTGGVFTVQLDFGPDAFPGAARYLEVGVRRVGDPAFTTLAPRQPVSATPYAIRSTAAATATNFSGGLAGDVTGTQSATVVSSVGGESAANVAGGAGAANAATNSNTAGSIVKRDASGNFSAGTITATLNGNASTATSAASATNFSGGLGGDVTGTQAATVVSSVGGQSAANVASGASAANAAASANTAGAIVRRDASGNFSAGTITASLSGNATSATTATNATTAATASSVSAAAGDSVVTAINASSSTVNAARLPSTLATQNGTNTFSGAYTFSSAPTFGAGLSAGGQRVTSVATPTADGDAATKAYVDALAGTASGAAGGHLAGSYPNPSIATTASAGANIVAAVNASSASVNTANVAGDVELLPSDTQTATLAAGQEDDLIDVQLNGGTNTDLGTSGVRDLLSLRVNGTFRISGFPHARDMERFRVDNAGGILAVGGSEEFEGSVPVEGSGARFMWYPGKRAIRAGYINGTQWDDANIGLYSAAFGYNARASGDYGFAVGQDVVAANSWSVAMGQYVTGTGAAAIALGYYAHTNSRQGSFVFSDRSVLHDDNIATDESFKAASNHSFNVRATGGYYLFTNTGVSTGLRLSHLLSTNASYGSFVWTDRSSDASITPTAQNQTIFRSDGGYWLYSNAAANAGVTLAPGGGSWSSVSDRNMKTNFAAVDARAILRGVLALPISTWNYKSQAASVRHIGPMAQDFFAAFKVGEGDKTISTIDPDGVALAAIQGLNEELKDRDARIDGLQQRVKQQQGEIDALKKLVCQDHPEAAVCKEAR